MKKSLILGLCVFAQLLFSQEEKKSFVTFSVVKPVVSFAPRIVAGYVHQLNDRAWLGIEAGYGSDGTRLDDRTENNYRGFEIRPEFYYDTKASERIKHFVSFSLFYIEKTQVKTLDEYTTDDGDFRFDRADYMRNKKGFTVSYAPMIPFGRSKSFYFMPKIGIGLANSTIKYDNVINRQEIEDLRINWLSISHFGSTEKNGIVGDFKIVYRF
ncbi:hypothetical protein OF897_07430 [Chryseobacterium formosus]|uniref:Outer membrane protein beta-barrel domain-containing protein n=1 Tax=Chryseobacterium formosus TaxID=1537363 RepID=A0ABT3XQY6_9FLAO|nr:hypothetical protein [Chryseobacterium formosus]MCX8523753.1 hypothetical protein [Chryseobacterium formosus]